MKDILDSLGSPEKVYSRKEILSNPYLVPRTTGMYACEDLSLVEEATRNI